MQRLVFEYSPAFIILCLGLGLGYAWLLYKTKYTWGHGVNRILFVVRAIAVALLAFLLIGPILKLTINQFERPSVVFLIDNSLSMKEAQDTASWGALVDQIRQQGEGLKEKDYDISFRGLDNQGDISFRATSSDIHGALRTLTADYEGRNLAAVVLVSDGIYNSGPSPLYSPLRIPVYTVGYGDTTQRVDLAIRNIAYNKVAYQGNRFPMRAEVLVKGVRNQDISVSALQDGKVLHTQNKNSQGRALIEFDFQIDANVKGIQRIDIALEPLRQETNLKNNRASVFVEVVEGKKKILVVTPSPHPDIKAIRATVEKNANYELNVHIPGVKEVDASLLQPEKTDLAIFSQILDQDSRTTALFQKFQASQTGLLLMVGARSNLRQLGSSGIPMTFENVGQKDDVTPTFNASFRDFAFSDGLAGIVAEYPPVITPFGKFTHPPDASILLYQKIGSVVTSRPLLFSWSDPNHKVAILLGEGIWRWRLNEYSETEKSDAFDEIFSKLIQYLSTREDKRKFRSFPIQNEFSDSEPVIFESQVYNDLFEQVYGNTVNIELRDESGSATRYSYVTSPSGTRYRIGGLREGIYRYTATTDLPTGPEKSSGEFLVTAQNLESQNLTADLGLLRKLSAATGGKFYQPGDVGTLAGDLGTMEAQGLIHSEDSFHPMINLKAIFFLLLFLLSLEWFARKYFGSY